MNRTSYTARCSRSPTLSKRTHTISSLTWSSQDEGKLTFADIANKTPWNRIGYNPVTFSFAFAFLCRQAIEVSFIRASFAGLENLESVPCLIGV